MLHLSRLEILQMTERGGGGKLGPELTTHPHERKRKQLSIGLRASLLRNWRALKAVAEPSITSLEAQRRRRPYRQVEDHLARCTKTTSACGRFC